MPELMLKLMAKLDGRKTYLAALGFVVLGIYDIIDGSVETGVQKIVTGLGMVGIGHKIDKSGVTIEAVDELGN